MNPIAADLRIPRTERCEVCGQPLGVEPYWIVEYPKAVHERCRDWSGRAFPYRPDLDALRRLVRRMRVLTREAVHTGRALAAIERDWPADGARALGRARRLIDELRPKLARIGIEWRR